MDKDEILAKSRKENRDADLVELEVLHRANGVALSVSLAVCAVISILSAIGGGMNYSVWAVQFSMLSTIMLVKFAKLKRRHELLLGILYAGFALFFFVFYLHRELGVF